MTTIYVRLGLNDPSGLYEHAVASHRRDFKSDTDEEVHKRLGTPDNPNLEECVREILLASDKDEFFFVPADWGA